MQGARSDYWGLLIKRGTDTYYYELSDEYDQGLTGFAGDLEYFGYLDTIGNWVIQQHTISTGAWRYVAGSSGYNTAWGVKGSLSYVLYSAIFG